MIEVKFRIHERHVLSLGKYRTNNFMNNQRLVKTSVLCSSVNGEHLICCKQVSAASRHFEKLNTHRGRCFTSQNACNTYNCS
jgi:hypothetical protein